MIEETLKLIPKVEKYIEYMLNLILKLPRVEKFNIGNECKTSLYKILQNVIYLNKARNKLDYLNIIDAELILQRIYLRIMVKSAWIDERKFKIAMAQIAEIGKIVGGLIKYYANHKKPI